VPVLDEHDRYERFIARLAAEAELSDAFVAAFIDDVKSDPDRVMAESPRSA
jgi:hypothetical protein